MKVLRDVTMTKNIAVVGAGFWGRNHVRNFYELGVLHTICDTSKELKNEYETKYPDIHFTESFAEVLSNDRINAIVIATPAICHYQMAKKVLMSGKHVLVEKPISLHTSEGEELVRLADDGNLTLMVGHILRYHPAVEKLKELIDKGELGKIEYIYSNRLNIGKIRSEENILWSFAPHDISVILYLLSEFPKSVYATGGSYLQHQIPDVTITTMDFKSGTKAHIFVSWLHPFKEQKLVVIGDRKMAVFDDLSKEKLFLYPHRIEWVQRIPVACKEEAEMVPIKMEEPLRVECQHFLDCIKNKQKPETDGEEGIRVLQVLQVSQESLSSNGLKLVFNELNGSNKQKYFVHDSSYIDKDVEIGSGTQIWHFSHVMAGSRIGENCKIGQNVVIGTKAIVGDDCKIQNNVSIFEGVIMEDEVFCGPSCVFTNVLNPRSAIPRMKEHKTTVVKKGATIGANATIICGHTIGEYAFIGAGAVVTKDVPDYALVVGNPGKVVGWMCQCGTKLLFELHGNEKQAVCKSCGTKYINYEDNVKMCIGTNKVICKVY